MTVTKKKSASDSVASASKPSGLVTALYNLTNYVSQDFLGGPRPWRLSWVINFQKAGTFIFIALLMGIYENTSMAAWVYLALHGTYGFVWLLKDVSFPDGRWKTKVTIPAGFMSFFSVLAWYWLIGWLLISGTSSANYPLADAPWFAMCISLCILGCVIMMVADAQKFYTLRNGRSLIKDGIHKYIRHPNYTGEIMIYLSFALMVWHWLAFVILAVIWVVIFAVNMIMKEASLSRYAEWAEYKKTSWWLIPFIL